MGLFDKLFDSRNSDQTKEKLLAATGTSPESDGDNRKNRLGLIVVFDRPASYSTTDLQRSLRAMSPLLSSAEVQQLERTAAQGTPVSRVSWAQHIVNIVGFDVPLPSKVLEENVQPAHYSQETKKVVRAQKAHAILYYGGSESDPLEQYVARAIVAGAFANHGALAVINGAAMTSIPAKAVYDLAVSKPDFSVLRHMPLLLLFCGFVKYFLPDRKTAWMRTYNNPTFGLPDLATKGSLDQAQSVFNLFSDLLAYLLNSKAKFAPGQTAEVGPSHVRFRAPREDEPFPTHSAGQLLILEPK